MSAFTGQLFSEELLGAITTRTVKNSGSDLTAHIQPFPSASRPSPALPPSAPPPPNSSLLRPIPAPGLLLSAALCT